MELREFADLWQHDRDDVACCLLVDDDALEEDAEAYSRCDTCVFAERLEGLCQENRDAWALFRQAVNRFTMDTHTVPLVLHRLTADRDGLAFEDMTERLALLYDVLCPPPKRSEGS